MNDDALMRLTIFYKSITSIVCSINRIGSITAVGIFYYYIFIWRYMCMHLMYKRKASKSIWNEVIILTFPSKTVIYCIYCHIFVRVLKVKTHQEMKKKTYFHTVRMCFYFIILYRKMLWPKINSNDSPVWFSKLILYKVNTFNIIILRI